MIKRFSGVFVAGVFVVSLMAGCGGGGSSAPAAPVTKTAAKNSVEKSISVTGSLDNEIQLGGGNLAFSRVMASRMAARVVGTVVETDNSITYINEVDQESGCTQNGSLNFTQTSNTTASISGSIVETNCTDSFDNGTSTMSGTISVVSSSLANVSMTTSFAQAGSSVVASMPITGTLNLDNDTFNQTSTNVMTLNGTDADGYRYTTFVVTDAGNGAVTISGRITETSSGFYITYSNSRITGDNTATLNFTTSDGVTGAVTSNADGSGTGTLRQTSNNALLLTVTWDAAGAGTITYADDSTELITMS